jgi:UDP-2,3-diacylglucosamine pyrophosphatase LpxH
MTVEKEIIVIGDIEMGGGTLTDDFNCDKRLANLLKELAERPHPVDLVLNGDTFDFLKCPSQLQPKTKYPRHITKNVSLAKLRLIYRAHLEVFKGLNSFLSGKEKTIYFILGNHDHDIIYTEVQEEIRTLVGGTSENVIFPGIKYRKHSVYIEHGHMYDFLFVINFEKLFLKHKGESILNFPFVSFGALGPFMNLKEQHPFMERIFPRPQLLTHHRVVARKLNRHTAKYFLKSLLYYPFRFYSDPTYSFPTNLIREIYKRIRTVHWDVDNITNIFVKKRRVKNKIIVLGHIHEKRMQKGKKRVIIHPGSWRDEYDFNSKTRELVPRMKRYVQIEVRNGEPSYNLIDLPLHRSILDFDEVIKDEIKHVKLAAKEEGYSLSLF